MDEKLKFLNQCLVTQFFNCTNKYIIKFSCNSYVTLPHIKCCIQAWLPRFTQDIEISGGNIAKLLSSLRKKKRFNVAHRC